MSIYRHRCQHRESGVDDDVGDTCVDTRVEVLLSTTMSRCRCRHSFRSAGVQWWRDADLNNGDDTFMLTTTCKDAGVDGRERVEGRVTADRYLDPLHAQALSHVSKSSTPRTSIFSVILPYFLCRANIPNPLPNTEYATELFFATESKILVPNSVVDLPSPT